MPVALVGQGGLPVEDGRIEDQGAYLPADRVVRGGHQSHGAAQGVAEQHDAAGAVPGGVADGRGDVAPFCGAKVTLVIRAGRGADVVAVTDRQHREAERVQGGHHRESVSAASAQPVDQDHPGRPAARDVPGGHAAQRGGDADGGVRDSQRGKRIAGVRIGLDAGRLTRGQAAADVRQLPGDGARAGSEDCADTGVAAWPGEAEGARLGRIRSAAERDRRAARADGEDAQRVAVLDVGDRGQPGRRVPREPGGDRSEHQDQGECDQADPPPPRTLAASRPGRSDRPPPRREATACHTGLPSACPPLPACLPPRPAW